MIKAGTKVRLLKDKLKPINIRDLEYMGVWTENEELYGIVKNDTNYFAVVVFENGEGIGLFTEKIEVIEEIDKSALKYKKVEPRRGHLLTKIFRADK